MPQTPRINKEHETNIGTMRVAMGYTLKQLASSIGASVGFLSGLQNGMIAPYYEHGAMTGKLKRPAEILCLVLYAEPHDLWPRDICDIERGEKNRTRLFTKHHLSFVVAEHTKNTNPHDLMEKKQLELTISNMLHTLTSREEVFLRFRFGLIDTPKTFREIGERFGLTHEGVRQVIEKGLRKIRHPSRSRLISIYKNKQQEPKT